MELIEVVILLSGKTNENRRDLRSGLDISLKYSVNNPMMLLQVIVGVAFGMIDLAF